MVQLPHHIVQVALERADIESPTDTGGSIGWGGCCVRGGVGQGGVLNGGVNGDSGDSGLLWWEEATDPEEAVVAVTGVSGDASAM